MHNKPVAPQITCADGLALFGQYFSMGAPACVGHLDTSTVKRPAVELMTEKLSGSELTHACADKKKHTGRTAPSASSASESTTEDMSSVATNPLQSEQQQV